MSLPTHESVLADGEKYNLSLQKVLGGRKIVDIFGYVSPEFGNDNLVFKINKIVLDDGKTLGCDGEHDIAYIYYEEIGEDVLENIYKTDPDYEE